MLEDIRQKHFSGDSYQKSPVDSSRGKKQETRDSGTGYTVSKLPQVFIDQAELRKISNRVKVELGLNRLKD